MRYRHTKSRPGDAGILLSPLIDCVFLLLIFFLVTSMLKRWEHQIPVTLADPTATVATMPQGEAIPIGIDRQGRLHAPGQRNRYGVISFTRVNQEPGTFLDTVAAEHGRLASYELVVEPGTPFQTVIDILDIFELKTLDRVRVRMRERPFEAVQP